MLSARYFLLSYKKKFVTKFVICITKFVTCITKFLTCVTKFVTNFFLYDSEKYQQANKKYLLWSKKSKADRRRCVVGQAKKKRARLAAHPFQRIFS